jgi:cell division protein FtsN
MRTSLLCLCLSLVILAALGGCASSGTQSEKLAPASSQAPPAPPKESAPAQPDTVSVAVQKAQKPSYESADPVKTAVTPSAIVKYCVQVGAYKQQENADLVASVAKTRFARTIYTIHDAASDLYKVMVGDFTTKDDARSFRDRMVQQYPGDYKDAWVSELAQ